MPTDADFKALAKTVDQLSKAVDGLKVMVKAHEALLKTLAARDSKDQSETADYEARKMADKLAKQQNKIEDQIRKLDEIGRSNDTEKEFAEARKDLDKLEKQKAQLQQTIVALGTAQKKADEAIQAQLDTVQKAQAAEMKAVNAQLQAMVDKATLDARLKVLEALIHSKVGGR